MDRMLSERVKDVHFEIQGAAELIRPPRPGVFFMAEAAEPDYIPPHRFGEMGKGYSNLAY